MTDRESRPTILAIDDTPDNLSVVSAVLKDDYRVKVAINGNEGLRIAMSDDPPDLILLDVMMPDLDGHEVCRRLKATERCRDIPVIFLTAMSESEDEEFGLSLGAVDYITKPISPPILHARVKTHLRLKEANDFLKDQNRILEVKVAQRTRQLATVQDVTMVAMGSLAETRDNETGAHIRRVQFYVKTLALVLEDNPRFSDLLTTENIELLFKSAPLHDIGKVGVPDSILLKPGRLTKDEFEQMKLHSVYGRDAIIAAEHLLDESESFLRFAIEIAYSHHEKWDGTGYPEGYSGDAIPISARFMALADVYDALVSRRCYKDPIPHDQTVDMIKEGRGLHFDPDVVDAFLDVSDEFDEIYRRIADPVHTDEN